VRLVVATLVTLVCGLLFTACFATLVVGRLNLISISFAVLYIGLGVDFAIHLGLRFQDLAGSGAPPRDALVGAARDIGPSLLLCALTTAVGFYAFIPTDYVGVAELGVIAGTGMLVSLVVTLTLLPALLALLAGLAPRRRAPRGAPAFLAGLPLHHARAVRVVALVLAVASLALVPRARFDYDPLNLRDPGSESVSTFRDVMEEGERPLRSITVLVPDAPDGRELSDHLEGLASVDEVLSLESFVPARQDEKLSVVEFVDLILGPQLAPGARLDPPDHAARMRALDALQREIDAFLDADRETPWREHVTRLRDDLSKLREQMSQDPDGGAARLEKLEAGLFETFDDNIQVLEASLRAGPIGAADLPKDLIEAWRSPEGVERVEVFPVEDVGALDALIRFVDEVRGVAPDATGQPVVRLESGLAVVRAFRRAFVLALTAIGILLVVVLRRPADALRVLVPLLLAGLLTTATAVLLDMPFNFANVIALPLLLGIGVDSGIHVVHRMRASGSYGELLRSSTARGVYYSALTTVGSFFSLSFSAHLGTASMGALLSIGLLFTLAATLVVLPTLLTRAAMDPE
jgi:hopanoid biosynthesis associated RND transporter like protein HpnN